MENQNYANNNINEFEEVEILSESQDSLVGEVKTNDSTTKTIEAKVVETQLRKVLRMVGTGLMYLGIGTVFYGLFAYTPTISEIGIRNDQVNGEFERVYDAASSKYADANSDGVISPQELDAFDRKFLASNGFDVGGNSRMNLKYGPMPYLKGTFERAEKETITDLLKNYKQ